MAIAVAHRAKQAARLSMSLPPQFMPSSGEDMPVVAASIAMFTLAEVEAKPCVTMLMPNSMPIKNAVNDRLAWSMGEE